MKVLRSLTISVALDGKFASLSDFEKIQEFFGKTILFFLQTIANFQTFWEILLSHSHYNEKLLPIASFKDFKFFFRKPICFLKKSPDVSTVLRNLTNSVAFYRKLANFSDFKNTLVIFLPKQCLLSKAQILNVSGKLGNSVPFWSKFAAFSIFCKKQDFFRKTHLIPNRSHFLNVLRSLTFSVAFYGKFATLALFKKFRIFFQKPICFLENSPKFLTVSRNLTCSVAVYSKFATFTVFLSKTISFEKPIFFKEKKTDFERFEKLDYFSRILLQICKF